MIPETKHRLYAYTGGVFYVRVVEWQTHPAKNRHTEGSTPSTDTNGGFV